MGFENVQNLVTKFMNNSILTSWVSACISHPCQSIPCPGKIESKTFFVKHSSKLFCHLRGNGLEQHQKKYDLKLRSKYQTTFSLNLLFLYFKITHLFLFHSCYTPVLYLPQMCSSRSTSIPCNVKMIYHCLKLAYSACTLERDLTFSPSLLPR